MIAGSAPIGLDWEEAMDFLERVGARVSMRLNSSGRCFGLSKYDQIENVVWIFGPTPSRYARVVRSMANSCADLHLALAEADIFCLVSLFQLQGAPLWLRDNDANSAAYCRRRHHVCSERFGDERRSRFEGRRTMRVVVFSSF